ncbi:MAG: hypothetical protein PVF49_13115, partial [Anaerolineales bacterium]
MSTKLAPAKAAPDTVYDELHGTRIADPYRWLEDWEKPETQEWTFAQDEYTRSTLASLAGRDHINKRLKELLSIGYMSAARPRNDRYFYIKREGEKNQPILYMREGLDGDAKAMVDPNELSETGIVALDWWYPSPDGRFIAYGLSEAGSEISTLHILDVDKVTDLEERIPHTRAAAVSWDPDNTGFYYTRYPKPGTVPEGEEAYHRTVYHHTIGDDPADDPLIFKSAEMQDWPNCLQSDDGRYLLVAVHKGWTRSE